MLGKLMKYEFKNTAKTMLTTYAVLAVCTVMGALSLRYLNERPFDNTVLSAVGKGMLILYVVSVIAVYSFHFIYLFSNYYKTMYSAQGYLTHTLPVSPAATLNVKIFSFFIWMVASTLLSVLSFLCFLWIGADMAFLRFISFFTDGTLVTVFGEAVDKLILSILLSAFLGILLCILWIAASMAIGQLFHKNRTGFTVLAAAFLYIANQMVNTSFLIYFANYNSGDILKGNIDYAVEGLTGGATAINAVCILVLYGICLYINKKRLNLE